MFEIEPIPPAGLRPALAAVLAAPGQRLRAADPAVSSFCEYLARCSVGWEGLRCGPAGRPVAVFFSLLLPGATAIVMVPEPGEGGIDPERQAAVTAAGLAALRDRRLHYAQALLEPEARRKRELLVGAGFRRLASLAYLERGVLYPWVDPPRPDEAEWLPYGPDTAARFAAVVQATYIGSRDCPELTGLRPVEDALAAHRASGVFDPARWELAQIGGAAVGCLLLAQLAHGPVVEVVYMGVVPGWRGRGVGDLLLRRALAQARGLRAERLTLVVDERNEPAQRLYRRFAFAPLGRREAYLYRWE